MTTLTRDTEHDQALADLGDSAPPRKRQLRIFPFDPMLDRFGRSVIADVTYERLEPGPSGRLVQVIDYDPVRDVYYVPANLDDPAILRNKGLDLAESDPRFHQQMVYAVVMRVLELFERGLGRPFEWSGEERRLKIFPHAFHGENAFFDPHLSALLFGYFNADEEDPGPNLPGQTVFTCLSHDIIAHETTHAVVHRLRPSYSMPTNPDVLSFHEGFADVIAILQHFTYPEVVAEHIASARTDLTQAQDMLSLAEQFGFAGGQGKALRTALDKPSKTDYQDALEEHDRGAVLVAAIVDGFLRSYSEGIADLLRLATAGTGVLQPGALHPDLVRRVSETAAQLADRVLTTCVGAFDYLPPVDLTFADYLRGLVTADFDLFPDDPTRRRANLIEGFRIRGIYPVDVASLAVESLRIEPVDPSMVPPVPFVRERILDTTLEFDRRRRAMAEVVADNGDRHPTRPRSRPDSSTQPAWAQMLHTWANRNRAALGLDRRAAIQVAGFHTALRVDADGYVRPRIAVQLVQRRRELADELGGVVPMGGTTVIAEASGTVRYVISKRLPTDGSPELEQLRGYLDDAEHRLRNVAWNEDPSRRIVDRLNLRALDGA